MNVATERPAELSTFVAGIIGLLVAFNVPLTEGQTAAIIGFVGLIPGAVTWIVNTVRAARQVDENA